MAKKPTYSPVSDRDVNGSEINAALEAINNGFENTLSRDGSIPNQMEADIDLNSNDLLNVKTLQATSLTVDGEDLSDAVTRAETAATNAEGSETNAATSASAAASSASSASSSATNAGTFATQASTSATNAATSETNAGTSETNAAASAAAASTSETNAATSATNAAASESSASTSASSASTSATSAATSASSASTSETNAATSETNASASATGAASSASAASTSETNAAASASSASTSATNAATSETNAAASASAASTSETNAGTSETNAAASAAAASTSETNAATSETNAASSASAASTSATNAATSETNAASSASAASTSATNAATSETNAAASAAAAEVAKIEWQGAWLTATAYAANDAVENNGASYICTSGHTSGASTEPGTGASWATVWDLLAQRGSDGVGSGDLLAANNLSDLANATTARTNLGVAIGSDVQAHSAVLDATTASFTTADETKLDGIESGADVTDATNVAAAGAVMASGDTMTGNLAFGDNDQIQFGDGNDLQIYHDGSNSWIRETGTGNLRIQGDTYLSLRHSAHDNLVSVASGGVFLYYAGAEKLKTTSTGAEITGNLTATGTVDGRDVAADGTKLDGIESGATADQSNAEIETAYNAQVAIVSQAAAEAGTSTTAERWTPQRVSQAIAALAAGGPSYEAAWVTATSYAVDDIVTHLGGLLICTSAHTSGSTTEPGIGSSWTSNWDLISSGSYVDSIVDLTSSGVASVTLTSTMPQWATEAVVSLHGASTAGTGGPPGIRMGTASYIPSASWRSRATDGTNTSSSTNRGMFKGGLTAAADTYYGQIKLTRWDDYGSRWRWSFQSAIEENNSGVVHYGAGTFDRSNTNLMVRVDLTTGTGSLYWDAGSAQVTWR